MEIGAYYDPVDLTVSHIDFGCVPVRKQQFMQCGGFDCKKCAG